MDDTAAMALAIDQARMAVAHDDVPVGAVMLDPAGEVVAADHNRREERSDPTAHAELLVIAAASRASGSWRLDGHTLFVTLEPCAMCAGATVNARLQRLVYGAADLKGGAALSLFNIPGDARLNHQVEIVAGRSATEAGALLRDFFRDRR